MSKRFYISGPMSGLPQCNFPAFHAAAARLRDQGYTVVNPAEFGEESGKTWEQYMRQDIKALCDCDTIYLLPGWHESKGAQLELHIAHRIGMQLVLA